VKDSKWRRLAAHGTAAIVAGILAVSGAAPVIAQDGDPVLGKRIWLSTANCKDCHGTLANGVQEIPQEPQGYNLRITSLSPEEMRDVVRCGRPGGLMPYFQRSAWTDRGLCYGMTAQDAGDLIPDRADRMLTDRVLDALIAMIYAEFVGKAAITFEMCVDFVGEGNSRCNEFPRARN